MGIMPPDINLILRINKLERLAANNPNEHEAAAARAKAARLRAQLPPEPPKELKVERVIDIWNKTPRKKAPSAASFKSKHELTIIELQQVLHRLKPSGQVFGADLVAQYYSKGFLTDKQWTCVQQLIEEADGNS
jgi:hypothetical protein